MSHFSAPGTFPLLQGVYQANSTTTRSLVDKTLSAFMVLIQ